MDDDSVARGWYEEVDLDDVESVRARIEGGSADAPRAAARERGRADDRQLIHAVRAMDDDPRAG